MNHMILNYSRNTKLIKLRDNRVIKQHCATRFIDCSNFLTNEKLKKVSTTKPCVTQLHTFHSKRTKKKHSHRGQKCSVVSLFDRGKTDARRRDVEKGGGKTTLMHAGTLRASSLRRRVDYIIRSARRVNIHVMQRRETARVVQ